MKEITSYQEFTKNQQDASLQASIGYRLAEKEIIMQYFSTHPAVAIVSCAATDYITGKSLSESVMLFHDGTYCWTNEEVYHFEQYDLKLNDDFVEYVLSKSTSNP
ncbi:MAG: hypothetical protein MR378_09610 [Ruminococcus sp.]|nr:hypothetical protein [Ruminococcus sp.]